MFVKKMTISGKQETKPARIVSQLAKRNIKTNELKDMKHTFAKPSNF